METLCGLWKVNSDNTPNTEECLTRDKNRKMAGYAFVPPRGKVMDPTGYGYSTEFSNSYAVQNRILLICIIIQIHQS